MNITVICPYCRMAIKVSKRAKDECPVCGYKFKRNKSGYILSA